MLIIIYNDRISSDNTFINQYDLDDGSFLTSDISSSIKKPDLHNGDLKLNYNLNSTSLLEYNLKVSNEKIKTIDDLWSNNNNSYHTSLNSEDFFISNKLILTKRINSNNALQFNLNQSYNDLPQLFTINPSPFAVNNSIINNDAFQRSTFTKKYFELNTTYLTKIKNSKVVFRVGFKNEQIPFQSSLSSPDIDSEDYKNNLDYYSRSFWGDISIDFFLKKWKITPVYKLDVLHRSLEDDVSIKKTAVLNYFSMRLQRRLTDNSSLNIFGHYHEKPFEEHYLFSKRVLINNRTALYNSPNFNTQKIQKYALSYNLSDILNHIFIYSEFSYEKSKNNFLLNSTITPNYIVNHYFNKPSENETLNFNLNTSWYLAFIRTKFNVSANYSINHYQNIINTSELRNNTSNIFSSTLKLNGRFFKKMDFENELSYTQVQYKSDNSLTNESFVNKTKISYDFSEKWYSTLLFEYYHPNTLNNNTFGFLDFETAYQFNKKLELHLKAINILNEKEYTETMNNDYSSTYMTNNLLDRSVLIGFTYTF